MENICAEILKMHIPAGEKPVKCVISGNEMDNGDSNLFSALRSSLDEVSDEEISTKKERHWRLGPEDLNDTLLFDFTTFEMVKGQEQADNGENSLFSENICAEIHIPAGEKPVKCVISGNEVDNGDINLFSALSSSLEEVSDEEISTKKERHWRLGPEDLNDTLLYDFTAFEMMKGQEQADIREKTH